MSNIHKLLLIDNIKDKNKNNFALPNVIGDSYLLKENKTYFDRRMLANKLSVKYKVASDDYQIASMFCLPQILSEKTVPFINNKTVLNKLKTQLKNITVDELVFLGFKENHLLHETSHVIMWEITKKEIQLKIKSELLLVFLLSESYANYSEVIANCCVNSKIHKDFLKLNSFWSYSEKEVLFLKKTSKKHGIFITNTVLFLCFLYSNFLFKKISVFECEAIRLFIGKKATHLNITEIKNIFKIANQLNVHFVLRTGEIFWKTLGYKDNFIKNLDFDPVEFILKKPKLNTALLSILAID